MHAKQPTHTTAYCRLNNSHARLVGLNFSHANLKHRERGGEFHHDGGATCRVSVILHHTDFCHVLHDSTLEKSFLSRGSSLRAILNPSHGAQVSEHMPRSALHLSCAISARPRVFRRTFLEPFDRGAGPLDPNYADTSPPACLHHTNVHQLRMVTPLTCSSSRIIFSTPRLCRRESVV